MMQEAAATVLKEAGGPSNPVDRIYSMPSFKNKVTKIIGLNESLTDEDFKIILTYLSRDKSVMAYDDQVNPFALVSFGLFSNEHCRQSNSKYQARQCLRFQTTTGPSLR